MSSEPSNIIVVRQGPITFVVFILVGLLFCIAPWFLNDTPILVRLFLVFLGNVCVAAAVLGWKSCRIGLIVDRNGVWCGGYSLRGPVLIPWASLVGARKVTQKSWEGRHDLILLGLRDDVEPPCGRQLQSIAQKELGKTLGNLEFTNAFLVGHDEWDWQSDRLVDHIVECVKQPSARERLGEYG